MGFIRDIIDDKIGLPDAHKNEYEKGGIMIIRFRFPYAFLNAIFQILDCVIIPYFTLGLLAHAKSHLSFFGWVLLVLGAFSSLYSLYQFLYYFVKPVDHYINPLSRFIGETAIGALLSSIFRITFKTKIGNGE